MKRLLTTLSQKWPEYLLEMIVITAGVLGAFALNNWNEHRLERQEEVKMLISVKKDLENTILEFEYLNGHRENILQCTRELLKLSNTDDLQNEVLDSLLAITFNRPTFNNKQGAIDLLFTSGKINLVKNDAIREQLMAWPGTVEDVLEEEIYANNLFLGPYYETIAKYVMVQGLLNRSFSTSFFGAVVGGQNFPKSPLESDYQALFKDKNFMNHIRMRAGHMVITNKETVDLVDKAQGIIQLIDSEIK